MKKRICAFLLALLMAAMQIDLSAIAVRAEETGEECSEECKHQEDSEECEHQEQEDCAECVKLESAEVQTAVNDENNTAVVTSEETGTTGTVIQADETISIDIECGEYAYYSFTPAYTESYTFYSTGNYSPVGYLYDSDLNQLARNSYGGEDSNFSITYTLEAGTEYIWAVMQYGSGTVSFDVYLQTNHAWSGGLTTSKSCTEAGLLTYTCSVCGATYTKEIPASHKWKSVITQAATCTTNGVRTYTCSACGASYTEEIPIVDHNFVNDCCTICGSKKISGTCGEDAAWELDVSTKTLTISGTGAMEDYYEDVDSSSIVDPKGRESAPWQPYRSLIESIVVEEGITKIGTYAFCECNNLTNVELPATLKTIGDTAFYECRLLMTVEIPENVLSVGHKAFYGVPLLHNSSDLDYDADWYMTLRLHNSSIEKCSICNGSDKDDMTVVADVILDEDEHFGYYCSDLDAGTYLFKFTPDATDYYRFYSYERYLDVGYLYLFNENLTEILKCNYGNGSIQYKCEAGKTYYFSTHLSSYYNTSVSVDTCHNYVGKVIEEATCTEAGTIEYICTECGDHYTNELESHHSFQNGACIHCRTKAYALELDTICCGKSDGNYIYFTYTPKVTDRYKFFTQENCSRLELYDNEDGKYEDYFYGSSSDTAYLYRELKAGKTYYLIVYCSDSISVGIKQVHKYQEELITVPNCDDEGTSRYTCIYCNHSYEDTVATSHTYENGSCILCGQEEEYYGTCGKNATWRLDAASKTLTISGSGDMYDYDKDYLSYGDGEIPRWSNYINLIDKIVIKEGITSIGAYAFAYHSLIEIDIPTSVKTIGRNSFAYCFVLKKVQLHNGLEIIEGGAFKYCEKLQEVHFPDSMTTIVNGAFANCGLTSVQLPAGLKELGENAFNQCEKIESIVVEQNNPYYDSRNNCNAIIETQTNTLICGCKNTIVPSGIVAIGNSAFEGCELTEISLPDGLQSISDYAFASCWELEKIDLPDGLQSIGSYAFWDCCNLKEINLPDGLQSIGYLAFAQCEGIEEIVIPSSVTKIAKGAFNGCDNLKTAIIYGNREQKIESVVFNMCEQLRQITFKGDAPEIAEDAFDDLTITIYYPSDNLTWTEDVMQDYGGTITWKPIPKEVASGYSGDTIWSLTDDGVLTFSGQGMMRNYTYKSEMPWYSYMDQITEVVIEDGITRIGSYAFYGMDKLTSITIPESVTNIESYAFKNATALDNVKLPSGLTKLGESAFYGCSSLSSIDLPASLWTVQPYTFKNCTNLSIVTFHEGNLQKISDAAFYGTGLTSLELPDCLDIIDSYAFKNCSKLTEIILGNGITEIREAVFYGTAIDEILIPEGVTTIQPYAFKNCTHLEKVSLPTTLTKIGESSFYGCTALKEMDIPDAVTVIEGYAFKGCTGLEMIKLPEELTAIGDSAFHTCTALKTIVIPAKVEQIGEYCFSGSYNLYQITFEGDAPEIGTGAFKGLAATAYYPSENTGWTDSALKNYGGSVTWKVK